MFHCVMLSVLIITQCTLPLGKLSDTKGEIIAESGSTDKMTTKGEIIAESTDKMTTKRKQIKRQTIIKKHFYKILHRKQMMPPKITKQNKNRIDSELRC